MPTTKIQKTAAWLLTEMIVELQDVELGRKATKKAINWVIEELEDQFQGFASNDRIEAWKSVLKDVDELTNSQQD